MTSRLLSFGSGKETSDWDRRTCVWVQPACANSGKISHRFYQIRSMVKVFITMLCAAEAEMRACSNLHESCRLARTRGAARANSHLAGTSQHPGKLVEIMDGNR
jgi:hypothetical protein